MNQNSLDPHRVLSTYMSSHAASQKFEIITDPGDWFVKKNADKLYFNDRLKSRAGDNYFASIIVHEAVHATNQSLPNKEDVNDIKLGIGPNVMIQFDVEADYHTAEFLLSHFDVSIDDFIGFHHDGRDVFKGTDFSVSKFERYVGSMLTMTNMKRSDIKKVYVPRFDERYDLKKVYTIVHGRYKQVAIFTITPDVKEELIKLYQERELYSRDEYIKSVNRVFSELHIVIDSQITSDTEFNQDPAKIPSKS